MRINGIELNVQVPGGGQPLVLLHGQGGNINMWQPEIDHFSRSFQTIAIDSRGHGRSDKPASFTLDDHVDDVLGVMDALGFSTVHLMGISMGSYIAQAVATREPHRVSKLVLIVPKAQGKTSSIARFLAKHAEEVEGKTPEEVQEFVRANIFAPTTGPEVRNANAAFIQEQEQAGLMLNPEQTLAASRALGGRAQEGFDFRPLLPRVTARTLVISGRHDPLNPPEEGQEIASLIPGARFVVMERSGHIPNREEPEHFLALVDAFLHD